MWKRKREDDDRLHRREGKRMRKRRRGERSSSKSHWGRVTDSEGKKKNTRITYSRRTGRKKGNRTNRTLL